MIFKRALFVAVIILSFIIIGRAPTPKVSAVDVLNICSSTGTVEQKKSCTDCKSDTGSITTYCKEASTQNGVSNPIIKFIKTIIDTVSYFAGAAAIIILIVSGLRLVLVNGDSNTVTTARNGILYSLAGIALIALAQLVVVFVLDRLK